MIARLLRLAVGSAVLLAVLVGLATPSRAQDPGTGAPTTPPGDGAIDDLVGCVQGSRNLLVLFMIDESASLKQTDPDDQRVDAARSALESLVALATSEGEGSPAVSVSLAAFADDFREVRDWTAVTTDSASGLQESLATFADLEDGIGTDFVTALDGARESLADEAAEVTANGGTAPCRALLVFTDGGYDIAVRESAEDQEELGVTKPYAPDVELTSPEAVAEAEALGRAALCDPGGLADQLRSDDVTVLTVALSSDVARRAQYPLAAATAGTADDYTCGTPSERAPGAYLPAEGVDVLITRFNEVGTRLAGGNEVPGEDHVAICDRDACEGGTRTFQLDASLRRAQVVALAPEPGSMLVLQSPGGTVLRIDEPITTEVGDVEVRARGLAERGLAVDLIRPIEVADWNGEWTASIVDPDEGQV
ncbi:MAG: VWA domain-containing protein, partial [Acidimicrobiales bacterium]|nr:VWA domain-containing protein [Acidimicrobiales bacterium]